VSRRGAAFGSFDAPRTSLSTIAGLAPSNGPRVGRPRTAFKKDEHHTALCLDLGGV